MNILIVDDSQVARRILKSCIPRADEYDFHEVDDGVAALETFKRIKPDVIFMDINMPNMGGLECLAAIRKVDPSASVIICSSEANQENIATAMSLGALAVIGKPPTREAVQAVLKKAIGEK